MKDFFNNAIGNELFFVYGLIALVIILIIVIVVIDKRDSKKKPQNLFDTLNMKIIADPNTINIENKKQEEVTKNVEIIEEEKNENIEIVEVKQNTLVDDFKDLEPIKEVNLVDSRQSISDAIKEIKDEVYQEEELDKTQAQIRVEEITKALKEAEVEEKIEKDKYEKFEEEQEKNAIISYNELKESFEKLYSENEKIQYLEDDEIPINIDELYQLKEEKEIKNEKAVIDDFIKVKSEPIVNTVSTQKTQSSFKSSPYISPVYGIQTPPVEVKSIETDRDIESANEFLKHLKELKSNLD